MVTIRELRDGQASSTNSSTGSVPTEVINSEDEDYDLDLPPYAPGFSRFPIFPPWRGDIIFNVSADEPAVDGETDEQRQLREQRNADRTRRRADEERQVPPHNLSDAFDMVGEQPVYKTPSANVAVAMANLDRLPDTPECRGVRSSVRAHLIAAMGQTATLLKRVQAVSYTEASSDQTNRSRTSPQPSGHHRNRSPNNHRKDSRRGDDGRDAGGHREQNHGRGQEVNQHRDLRYNVPPKDARDRINRRATERAVHENLRRIEYDATHGPPALRQFSSHLRQVVWPRNFKLEKLKKYDDKENLENWITLYEIAVRSAAGDEHVMANYFPVVLDQAGH